MYCIVCGAAMQDEGHSCKAGAMPPDSHTDVARGVVLLGGVVEEPLGNHASPWLFGLTNIPFGVASAYAGVGMPFLLSQAHLSMEETATIGALAMLPAAWQLFWAPVIDFGVRRRTWLIVLSLLGGLCLGASLLLSLPAQLASYKVLVFVGQLLVGLVSSCNGALVSTTLPQALRGRAAGFINAANLGSAVLGGGLVIRLSQHATRPSQALALFLMIALPALAALAVPEPPPVQEPLETHLGRMARDVWDAVRSRLGWTGILFCISPVGTAALTNLFSAFGQSMGATDVDIEFVNGYLGGFVTAAGALVSGFFLHRFDARRAYLLGGGLTALCAFAMACAPQTRSTFIVGSLCYLLFTGLCYAAFSAVVYEIVGTAGSTASTLYSIFPAAGNQAIAYTMFLDGKAHKAYGVRGLLMADGLLNVLGIGFLLFLLHFVLKPNTADSG